MVSGEKIINQKNYELLTNSRCIFSQIKEKTEIKLWNNHIRQRYFVKLSVYFSASNMQKRWLQCEVPRAGDQFIKNSALIKENLSFGQVTVRIKK